MSVTKSRWMKRLGIGTVALLGLGAVSLQSTPANARVFFSVGVPAYGYGYRPLLPISRLRVRSVLRLWLRLPV